MVYFNENYNFPRFKRGSTFSSGGPTFFRGGGSNFFQGVHLLISIKKPIELVIFQGGADLYPPSGSALVDSFTDMLK